MKLVTTLLALASFAAAQAATVTLFATKDTSLYPTVTGSETTLTAKPGQQVLVGFDLSGIPIGSVIQEVQLRLYHSDFTDPAGISFDLSSLFIPNETWNETSISINGYSAITTLSDSSSQYMLFTGNAGSGFLNAVQNYVSNPTANNGFGFDYIYPEPNPFYYEELSFFSREGGMATGRAPLLTVTYTIPEPSTAILGIISSGFLFRRRRQS